MKKIIAIIAIIAATTGILFLTTKPQHLEMSASKGEGKTSLPLLSMRTSLELPKAVVSAPEETKEFIEALDGFKEGLAKLKKVTARYNKKALTGKLTQEDEAEYEAAEKKALVAYEDYKKSFIKLNYSKEN